jgi:hypothetical protein
MRVPRQLLNAVRASTAKAGVPYQRFIHQALKYAAQRKCRELGARRTATFQLERAPRRN